MSACQSLEVLKHHIKCENFSHIPSTSKNLCWGDDEEGGGRIENFRNGGACGALPASKKVACCNIICGSSGHISHIYVARLLFL